MFDIVVGALSWVFRLALIKFVVMTGIFVAVWMLWPILLGWLPAWFGVGAITNSLQGIPSGVWWFMSMFRVDLGLEMVVTAFTTRFLIRRLPVIG